MSKDSGKALAELAVDGGMTNSDLCMQVTSPLYDFLNTPSFGFSHSLLATVNYSSF
jgi:hypothetical protein